MLEVRAPQFQVFANVSRDRFEDEMVAHSRQFSPVLSATLEEAQLRTAVRGALRQGEKYGFDKRGPLRLCVEAMFLHGSSFATDPQYPWMAAILECPDDQMARAEALCNRINEFQRKVYGQDGINTERSLRDLLSLARLGVEFTAAGYAGEVFQEMRRVFPEKAAYVGDPGLRYLIQRGSKEARRYELPVGQGDALLTVLMFAFGHGCTDDPLYPWIRRTLIDERLPSPAARGERLHKKAVTWLENVLTNLRPAPTP